MMRVPPSMGSKLVSSSTSTPSGQSGVHDCSRSSNSANAARAASGSSSTSIEATTSEAGGIAVLAWVGTADERVPCHEDGLAPAEVTRVCLSDRFDAQRLQLDVALPQSLLKLHDVAVHHEARPLERRLRVEAVVDDGG